MAFFLANDCQYLSLLADPTSYDGKFLYKLNHRQMTTSDAIINPLVILSSFLLIMMIGAAVLNQFEREIVFSADFGQGEVVSLIGVSSGLLFFIEVFFFLWIRRTSRLEDSDKSALNLTDLHLIKKKSFSAYIVSLINITTPIVGFFALDGGMHQYAEDIARFGTLFILLNLQLLVIIGVLYIVIIKKIFRIILAPV